MKDERYITEVKLPNLAFSPPLYFLSPCTTIKVLAIMTDCGIIQMQRERQKNSITKLNFKKEQSGLLRCSEDATDCSFLDFKPNQEFISDETAIDYLASILAEIFLALHNEKDTTQ